MNFLYLRRHLDYAQREILQYLASPHPADLLDVVINGSVLANAAGQGAS
jgi:hypothetical protein